MEQSGILESRKEIFFRASNCGELVKAFADGQNMYVVVKVSDSGVDLQKDIISPNIFSYIIKAAKEGNILLTRTHQEPFGIGVSADGWVENEPGGLVSLYLLFKLKPNYPEAVELFDDVKNGKGNRFQVSVGGLIKDYTYRHHPQYGLVREITNAEVNHVAVTWKGLAVNPRTRFLTAMVKAFEEAFISDGDTLGMQLMRKEKEDEKTMEEKEDRENRLEQEEIDEKAVLLKEFHRVWDELEAERRRMNISEADMDAQMERAKRYPRISPSPAGFAVKPSIFAGVPDDLFGDPVNYLFPIEKAQDAKLIILIWRQYPMLWKTIYSNMDAAGAVWGRICSLARNCGIHVEADHPAHLLLSLPEARDIAPVGEEWHQLWRSALLAKEELEEATICGWLKKADEGDEGKGDLRKREEKYGYKAAPNAHLTKPKEYEHIPESQFADPVGYNYPIDRAHVLAAIRYFLKPKNRNVYDADAQIVIYTRILRAMKKFGHKHRFDPDNPLDWLVGKDLKRWMTGYEKYEEDDTPQKRAEARKQLEKEARKVEKGLSLPFAFVLEEILMKGQNIENIVKGLSDLFSREVQHGYWSSPYAHLSKPDEEMSDDDYADPVGYRFPVATVEQTLSSLSSFANARQFYSVDAQKRIYERLIKAAVEKFNMDVPFDPDNNLNWLLPPNLKEKMDGYQQYRSVDTSQRQQKAGEDLQKEYQDNNLPWRRKDIINIFPVVFALLSREAASGTELQKTVLSTTPGLPFNYFVLGDVTRVHPSTKVCVAIPTGRKAKIVDLSAPIRIVKDFVGYLSEQLAGKGADYQVRVEKSEDNAWRVYLNKQNKDIAIYEFDGEQWWCKVNLPLYGAFLMKGDIPGADIVTALEGKLREVQGWEESDVLSIGAAHIIAKNKGGTYFLPIHFTEGGDVQIDSNAVVCAKSIFIPDVDDICDMVMAASVFDALCKNASTEWLDYFRKVLSEIESEN